MLLAAIAAAAEPIRIMPLGDSITRGAICPKPGDVPGGYRTRLWKRLTDAGHKVHFVGADTSNPDPGKLPNPNHNGYKGWTIEQIDAKVVSWLKESKPDVVLLHIGTNNAFQKANDAAITASLDKLITHITTESPKTYVVVAQIIDTKDANIRGWIQNYNKLIPGIVAKHAKNGERVTMVNMTKTVPPTDFADPYHPNKAGYDRMGDAWFTALKSLPIFSHSSTAPVTAR
jgi:lysophospholipase L1-like esterase